MNSPAAVPTRAKKRSSCAIRGIRPPKPIAFKALIAYGDVPAARRAISEIRDVVAASRRGYQFWPMLWRFDQLNGRNWSEIALRDATEAAIVVLASTESSMLPAGLEQWVSTLVGRIRGRPITIVAVLGATEAWTISIETPQPASEAPVRKAIAAPPLRQVVAAAAAIAA